MGETFFKSCAYVTQETQIWPNDVHINNKNYQ